MAKFYNFSAGYSKTGYANDVYMFGSPSNSMYNISLDLAHQNNRGYGIGFEVVSENEKEFELKIILSLVSGTYVNGTIRNNGNERYIEYGGTYDWYIDIVDYGTYDVGKFIGSLYPNNSWLSDTSIYKEFTIKLPNNLQKITAVLRSADPLSGVTATFTREQFYVKRDYKPYRIRKSNTWKTLNVTNGYMKHRKNASWVNKDLDNENKIGQVNQGKNRIYKDGQWKGQRKYD